MSKRKQLTPVYVCKCLKYEKVRSSCTGAVQKSGINCRKVNRLQVSTSIYMLPELISKKNPGATLLNCLHLLTLRNTRWETKERNNDIVFFQKKSFRPILNMCYMNCKKYDFGIDCRSASICNVRNTAIALPRKRIFCS